MLLVKEHKKEKLPALTKKVCAICVSFFSVFNLLACSNDSERQSEFTTLLMDTVPVIADYQGEIVNTYATKESAYLFSEAGDVYRLTEDTTVFWEMQWENFNEQGWYYATRNRRPLSIMPSDTNVYLSAYSAYACDYTLYRLDLQNHIADYAHQGRFIELCDLPIWVGKLFGKDAVISDAGTIKISTEPEIWETLTENKAFKKRDITNLLVDSESNTLLFSKDSLVLRQRLLSLNGDFQIDTIAIFKTSGIAIYKDTQEQTKIFADGVLYVLQNDLLTKIDEHPWTIGFNHAGTVRSMQWKGNTVFCRGDAVFVDYGSRFDVYAGKGTSEKLCFILNGELYTVAGKHVSRIVLGE
jgi:hypothetical protein